MSPSVAAIPRAYVSRVLSRPQGDGYYFRVTKEAEFAGLCGRIYNRYRWSEAVVDRAATIVELAKGGFEVIYETGPGAQSLVVQPTTRFAPGPNVHAATPDYGELHKQQMNQ